MRPYLYTIITYFALMFLAKVAITLYDYRTKLKEKSVRFNWTFTWGQLRETVMSYLF